MAKVIIKPNVYLPDREFNDLYKYMNTQYKQNNIIVVPYYCDVYVVDGNPELKVEKKAKDNFTYADGKTAEEVKEIINNLKCKDCSTCKHNGKDEHSPCIACNHNDKWEAKEKEIKMAKIIYRAMFDNGNTVTFESTVNVDFHEIAVSENGAGSMAFDDMFLNLQHVVFIDKEIKNDG